MSETGTPILTPTFQALVSHNLLGLTDALNNGDTLGAFKRIEVIVAMLKKEHKQELVNNGLKQVNAHMAEINRLTAIDYDTTWEKRRRAALSLAPEVFGVFDRLMETLHEHNYLEQTVAPRYTKHKKLSVQ